VVPLDVAPLDVVPLVWLTLAPFEVTEPEGDADVGVGVDGLALVDVDADGVVLDLGVVDLGVVVGSGGVLWQRVPVASAAVLPFALVFALADAVSEAVVVAVLVGLAVVLGVVVAVLVAVVLSLGLELLLAGLPLVLLLAGLVAVAAGDALGDAKLVTLLEVDGEGLGGHTVAGARTELVEMLLGVRPPADDDIGLPPPAVRWAPLLLCAGNPTAWPNWTKAWRSGVTARTTPKANTAQATARPDRSSTSRQSRG